MEMAFAEPEPGVGELEVRVVVCITESLCVDVAEGFERREAAFAEQGGDVGEGEREFLFDFEEGHGLWGWRWKWVGWWGNGDFAMV